MSGVETIERELEQYLAESDYEVHFRYAGCHDFFTVYVLYRNEIIARKSVFKSYGRAERWARRQVRSHQKAMKRLAGLVRP